MLPIDSFQSHIPSCCKQILVFVISRADRELFPASSCKEVLILNGCCTTSVDMSFLTSSLWSNPEWIVILDFSSDGMHLVRRQKSQQRYNWGNKRQVRANGFCRLQPTGSGVVHWRLILFVSRPPFIRFIFRDADTVVRPAQFSVSTTFYSAVVLFLVKVSWVHTGSMVRSIITLLAGWNSKRTALENGPVPI